MCSEYYCGSVPVLYGITTNVLPQFSSMWFLFSDLLHIMAYCSWYKHTLRFLLGICCFNVVVILLGLCYVLNMVEYFAALLSIDCLWMAVFWLLIFLFDICCVYCLFPLVISLMWRCFTAVCLSACYLFCVQLICMCMFLIFCCGKLIVVDVTWRYFSLYVVFSRLCGRILLSCFCD